VPKALQNTLKPEDYFIIDHWRKWPLAKY
jgi:hypothetical protein